MQNPAIVEDAPHYLNRRESSSVFNPTDPPTIGHQTYQPPMMANDLQPSEKSEQSRRYNQQNILYPPPEMSHTQQQYLQAEEEEEEDGEQ